MFCLGLEVLLLGEAVIGVVSVVTVLANIGKLISSSEDSAIKKIYNITELYTIIQGNSKCTEQLFYHTTIHNTIENNI